MRLYIKLLFAIVLSYQTLCSHAQNTDAWSFHFPLPELTSIVKFPEPLEQIEQVYEEERYENSLLKVWVYAVDIETSLEPQTSGQWDTIPGKGYVWRIGIHAENALSLNLFIENYKMKYGMALYVYGKSSDNMAGPFDARNNANGGILPVQSLPGDMITVEWNIPLQAFPRNDFIIKGIGYGFRDMSGGKITPLQSSMECNIDINCKTGNHWQREKRAVLRLETRLLNGRTQYCTGTLVNQAVDAKQKKPYILTAHHCISSDELAKRTTFVFGYEKEYCRGDAPSVPTGITGSSLVATKRALDFTLLELLPGNLSAAHKPFYAGWTTSISVPQGATGIHHPQGDPQKISVEMDPLITGTFSDPSTDLTCDKNAHWIVQKWDEGLTEKGSSGSAIFDKEQLLVGTLSGGPAATCTNAIKDYYSKFNEQWNRYTAKDESLKPWLDPDNKNVTFLWGYDPVTSYEGSYKVNGNIGENEAETLKKSDEWGYLTSQNNRRWIGFAEKIKNDSTANIIGLEVHVAKVSRSNANVRFAVWRGSDLPGTMLTYKDMTVTEDYNNYLMHVYFDRTVSIEGDFFIGYRLDYDTPVDTFAVYHSTMRPYPGISGIYVQKYDRTWMALEDEFPPIYASLSIKAMGRFGEKTTQFLPPIKDNLRIIYQQNSNIALLLFDIGKPFDSLKKVTIECYDTSGKRLLLLNEVEGRTTDMYDDKTYFQVELDVRNFPPGVYIIQAFDKNKKLSGKFVRLH